MYIPANFSACAIYLNSRLYEQHGVLSDYNISDYCDYQGPIITPTEYHKSESEPLFIDLKFYSKRAAIPEGMPLFSAQTVTIHFEGETGKFSGLLNVPLIGSDKAVRSAVNFDKYVLTVDVIISALALSIFVFLCFLKRTISFLPQLLITLGVFGFFLSAFALTFATAMPYFWISVGEFSLAFTLLASTLSLRIKIGNFPLWLLFAIFSGANCILSFIVPLSALWMSTTYSTYNAIASIITAGAVIFFAGFSACRLNQMSEAINPLLAAIATIAVTFLPSASLNVTSPILWLFIAMIFVTNVISFRIFICMERRNVYLTANLRGEVERQTKDLQAVLDERDNLLRYVSHDLKKPVKSMEIFLGALCERENDAEQIKTLNIVAQKANELSKNLTELSGFSKLNFVSEQSSFANTDEILRNTFVKFEPDCSANGIILNYIPSNINIFCKRNALDSVISNIILNALEHSDCKTIALAAVKKKNVCLITVTDDGKGIQEGSEVFKPYYSENDNIDNLGLGLYLCKNLINSMGGDLTYTQQNGKLTFTITLPIG